jgi:deazaflavin-dependent oxidoreductase (nitroreductase family)
MGFFGDFNSRTISEFRKNRGRVGGNFEGAPLLLLHTIGRRTGRERVNPLMYLKDGERLLVFASKGGADANPDWYYNLKAHPDIQIEVGDEKIDVHAQEVLGTERDALYARQATLYPAFADYQRRTKRIIPVIALTGTNEQLG